MKTKKDALKEQEAEMLKQFDVKELEERLEMGIWGFGSNDKGMPTGTLKI